MLTSKINIGQLDTRLVFEINVPTQDTTTNEEIAFWNVLSTVSGKRMINNNILGGGIRFESDQEVAINTETFLIRYSSIMNDLDKTMRFHEKGESDNYYIVSIKKYKREGYIMVRAENRDN